MGLKTIFNRYGCNKGRRHGYNQPYERLLLPIRYKPLNLLEIGVGRGASLRTWEEFLPAARITAIDICPQALRHSSKRSLVVIGDQADRRLLRELGERRGPFDVVIDDGSHKVHDQTVSYQELWPYVRPGGFYAIEDIHTSLDPAYNPHGEITMLDRLLAEYRATVRNDHKRLDGHPCFLFYASLAVVIKPKLRRGRQDDSRSAPVKVEN